MPVGHEGEVYLENAHQFECQTHAEKTKACVNRMGWTTPDDIGLLEVKGYLYLSDRKFFVIITGRINVCPQKTESALLGHPAAPDPAVIGVPNQDFGEEVKAVVQLVPENTASPDSEAYLIAYYRAQLSAIKYPRSIALRKTLPRSATGKLYKRRLRDQYWEEPPVTSEE